MKVTVTLNDDGHVQPSTAAHHPDKSIDVNLNDAMRVGPSTVFPVPAWPVYGLGVPLVDLTKALAIADEMDDSEQSFRPT